MKAQINYITKKTDVNQQLSGNFGLDEKKVHKRPIMMELYDVASNTLPVHGHQYMNLSTAAQSFREVVTTGGGEAAIKRCRKVVERLIARPLGFTSAVIVNAVYRDTDASQNQTIAIPHIDFYKGVDTTGRWFTVLTNLPSILRLGELVNVWVSLEETGITDNNLAFLDIQTLAPEDIVGIKTTSPSGAPFTSGALLHSVSHRWYTKPRLGLGEGYVFYSRKTPHTAYRLATPKRRRSIEFRVILSQTMILPLLRSLRSLVVADDQEEQDQYLLTSLLSL